MELPFATCFICNTKGHLASQCQQNEKGIYINGGSCRTCGSTKHRASDCLEKKQSEPKRSDEPTEEELAMANEALLHGQGDEQLERKFEPKAKPAVQQKRRIVKF
jgi:zinc finger CCHC domain-containing protein 9